MTVPVELRRYRYLAIRLVICVKLRNRGTIVSRLRPLHALPR